MSNNEYVLEYDDQLEEEGDQLEQEEEKEVRLERESRRELKPKDEADKDRKFLLYLNQWDPGTSFRSFRSVVQVVQHPFLIHRRLS